MKIRICLHGTSFYDKKDLPLEVFKTAAIIISELHKCDESQIIIHDFCNIYCKHTNPDQNKPRFEYSVIGG